MGLLYLSSDKALNGVGKHDDDGIEESCKVGCNIITVVIEQVACRERECIYRQSISL